jgi:aminopeptidase N
MTRESHGLSFGCGRSLGAAASSTATAAAGRPFPLPGTATRWSRDRQVDMRHSRLEVTLDSAKRAVEGRVTHTFVPILDGLDHLDLDCVEIAVRSVRMGSRRLRFEVVDDKLCIRFARALPSGREASVTIEYRCVPRRGLYFIAPDAANPGKRVEAWTQGQDEDSRHWFPCFDYPNQKCTTEVLATVPSDMVAISNGKLVGRTRNARRKTTTWHWRQSLAHVSYLVTLVAGRFERRDMRWRKVPMAVWAPEGRMDDAMRSCRKTPRMMAFFSKVTGIPYPYEKYDQVFVQDFIFGGMENTTATTLTDTALLDRRSFLDTSMDPLVAHELAHQWWGDLVTCRDWSHGWLNEGFATYFEALWKEEDLGVDEYRHYLLEMRDSYLGEDGGRYRRPIVCKSYRDPVELFDRHLYEKGALVLHMLRSELGDDLWWRCIRRYARTHREGSVETDDLRRTVERETGRNLEWFFDQWVYKGGHPDFKVTFGWDDASRTATVTAKQGQPDDGTPVFRGRIDLGFALGRGREEIRTVVVDAREHSWKFVLPSRPRFVSFDRGWKVLKTLDFSPPRDMLVAQLKDDPDVTGRVHAAGALGKDASPEAVAALARCLASDDFWGVRVAAAAALGKARGAAARDALVRGLAAGHPKVRRAAASALGEWRDDAAAAKALRRRLEEGDASYLVEAEAARSLGRVRAPGALEVLGRIYDQRPGWNEVVRCGCLGGMAALRDAAAIPRVKAATADGGHNSLRATAVAALGRLAEAKDAPRVEIAEDLARFVDDPWLRVRLVACQALADLREDRGLGALDRAASADLDGRVRRLATESSRRIREGRDRGEEVKALRDELEKLRDDLRRLREAAPKPGAKAKG